MKTAQQSELLFLWDARMTNPNGDMLNDNAPRYDDVDRRAIVSDVRVKRTIRDDLQKRKGETIYVNNAEEVQSAETRFNELKEQLKDKDDKEVFLSCIDNRLFGGVAPKSNIQVIGAVQFAWSKTLNETEPVLSQGTGAFGKDGSSQKTFRMDNYIPYGLFAMYGTINQLNAKNSHATEDDIEKMLDSLWMGTKLLNTRSKTGQKSRLLVRIIYKDNYIIGLLDELIKLKNRDTDQLRRFEDCDLDIYPLLEAIKQMGDKVEKVVVWYDDSTTHLATLFKEIGVEAVIKKV
ncbi:type I-B CRISPR-associated protein Cas7/Csh2 [Hydrogenimonas thermophila]|uniref:type I-B CRISPR-associated protein Cas7/Csh2 n=1 Tax=Hydrogenimonas thermophila TaxID=223786 RepID=UPI002936D9B9|nr:type I-B CRISPR-associated protein Cas7/Csh2 [Hydrogenimonas thermophila]WOE69680.1 type I-B CRISPR-associated protein Cas7/Csh2 [Hydrogenimonas thermophila]WOE72194.1 type I-B CRISPR-associated protein Cas7/Csh2 [Hydrogenimonas thermophila]